jgi:membrane-associated phospholipid phosphatase
MFIKNLKTYTFLCILYFLAGYFILTRYERGAFELIVNDLHKPYLDFFFKYWTWVGDGSFFVAVLLVMLCTSYYYTIVGLVSLLIKTALVQYLKLGPYDGVMRPGMFFRDKTEITLNLVEGVELNGFNSFPSGHTASAFVLATFILLVLNNKYGKVNPIIQFLLFLAAFLVGVSRIYLHQHFFIDTYFGTLIALLCATLIFYLFSITKLKGRFGNRSLFHNKT